MSTATHPVEAVDHALCESSFQELVKEAKRLAGSSLSINTRRLYQHDWERFVRFCEDRDLQFMPASGETVSIFLAWEVKEGEKTKRGKVSVATLERRLSAIHFAHRGNRQSSPRDSFDVQVVLKGARRELGRKATPKSALVDGDIKRAVAKINTNTLQGLRDRAMLLLGFSGALRRSELAALEVADFNYIENKGALVTITQSKTDQEGRGQTIAILYGKEYCPLDAVSRWLEAAGIEKGPVFRRIFNSGRLAEEAISDKTVARIVKKYTGLAGMLGDYSGHSLRRGFITSAVNVHADLLKIATQSRHKNLDMVRRYVEERDKFKDHAGAELFKD